MGDFMPFKVVLSNVALAQIDAKLPGGGSVANYLATAFRQGWERRQSRTYRAAIASSGMSANELAQAMLSDPESQPMITRALLHAAMIDDGPMLDALGAAWGRAVADPTNLDDAERLVLGIGQLRPEDIQALKVMSDNKIFVGTSEESPESPENTAHRLAEQTGSAVDSILSSLIRLNSAGFVEVFHGVFGGGSAYRASRLGSLLREVMEALQDDA